jgi:hypothetical protein
MALSARGIFLRWKSVLGASNNTLYRNSFINNTKQVNDYHWTESYLSPSINTWDNGKEGNYWNDYTGRYPNAIELNSSGIWNASYVLDQYNKDNYPLMSNPLLSPSDTTPPTIVIVSPENKSYPANNVSLTFTVNETVFRMASARSEIICFNIEPFPIILIVAVVVIIVTVGAVLLIYFTKAKKTIRKAA